MLILVGVPEVHFGFFGVNGGLAQRGGGWSATYWMSVRASSASAW